MELRHWAERILSADTLEEKLLDPGLLTDKDPGSPLFWELPSRPKNMSFQKFTRKQKLPKMHELFNEDKRASCLHRFAGHELLAVEIMAYALLAFPYAPKHFRKGVANTLREEQGHVRLYIKELERFGMQFGDEPLFKYFWAYTPYLKTPEEYLSVMSLTFEMANLDYAPAYAKSFAEHGDFSSENLMKKILQDEIIHVSFGWNWLKKLSPDTQFHFKMWTQNLPQNLPPKRAMGPHFQEEHRRQAGISEKWLIDFKTETGLN